MSIKWLLTYIKCQILCQLKLKIAQFNLLCTYIHKKQIKLVFKKSNIITGRGGQSALRFARLRMEKRHNYVRKVAEVATQLYITNDKPNIAGLILAGSADFKTELSQSDMFDPVSFQYTNETLMLFILKRLMLLCYQLLTFLIFQYIRMSSEPTKA